jgi:hypothetical protein
MLSPPSAEPDESSAVFVLVVVVLELLELDPSDVADADVIPTVVENADESALGA